MRQFANSKKALLLVLMMVLLIGLSGIYVVGGTQAFSRSQQDTLAHQEHCGGQAPVRICVQAPSAIFSAFYRSYSETQASLFSIRYSSNNTLTLLISVTVTDFTQIQTHTVTATPTMQSSSFNPRLEDKALLNLTGEENTSLHVEARDNKNHQYYVDDMPLQLHSRHLMQWLQANRLLIAAWITPDDPAITELVTKAATHLKDQSPNAPPAMVGYDHASPPQVVAQVNAIYDTLRLDYHMKYVQASVPYSTDRSAHKDVTQTVKLPSETLKQGSGMCVELTNLLASAAEHIGLSTEIVIVPGHAFLGVADSPEGTHFQYWDAVAVNNNVAADSANVAANNLYAEQQKKRSVVDTILVSDARDARIGPML